MSVDDCFYNECERTNWSEMSSDEHKKYLADGGFGMKFTAINDAEVLKMVKLLYFKNRGRLNIITTEEYVEEEYCKYNEFCAYVWFENESSLDRFVVRMNDVMKEMDNKMYSLNHENRSQMEVYESFCSNHNLDITLMCRKGGPLE